MTQMLRNKLLIAVTALLLAAALPLAAQPPGGGFGPPEDGPVAAHLRALAAFLELTAEQVDAARLLLDDLRATTEPLHDQLATLHDDLQALLEQPSPDPTAVGETVLAIQDVRQQVAAARTAFEEAFVALLTPEQVVRYEAFKAAAQALRHGRRGLRDGSGGGPGAGGPGPGGPGPGGPRG